MFSTDNILAAIVFGKGKSGGEDGGGSGFSYAVSSGASDTPEGVSFYKGSSIITGALAASSAEPGRIYLVPSDNGENDNYDEYMAVQNESEEWVWEKIGNSDVNVGVSAIKGSAESNYRTGDVTITKANIGLSEVDNTSDLDKPISTATQAELDKRFETQTMTMAQYNALTTAQKNDGTVRYITDTKVLYHKGVQYGAQPDLSGKADKVDIDLISDSIPDTSQSYTYTGDVLRKIEHKDENNAVVRIDTFTYTDDTITEVRELQNGSTLTITQNLNTHETTIEKAVT